MEEGETEPAGNKSNYASKKEVPTKPPKRSSSPVKDVRESDGKQNGILRIGYKPSKEFEQDADWVYPVVIMPKINSVIRQPSRKKQQRRGYKEASFQRMISNRLSKSFDILGDCVISTGSSTRPFEPDITLRRLNDKHNIFIDIEIDEPYGGISRSVTHAKGEDDHRDIYFTDRGWIVIRFAEIQVHEQAAECIAYICKVIDSITSEIDLPANILNMQNPNELEQWDQLKAERWAQENYRESYLGHEFNASEIDEDEDSAIEFSEFDQQTEELVIPTKYTQEEPEPVRGKFNLENHNERDNRIQFYPEEHLYLVDEIPAKSVSEVVARFFPAFDRMGISERLAIKRGKTQRSVLAEWDAARDAGTNLHLQIENYFNGVEYEEPPAFEHFLNFIEEHSCLDTFRTEWRVFDDKKMIAGTIDYVTSNADGTYSIYDWKRSKNVVDEYAGYGPQVDHPFGSGFGPLRHLSSTAYNKYCLQQGIYKKLLVEHYGLKIRDMYLVVLHPRYGNFHKFQVEEYDDEVEFILKNA